MSKAGNYQIPYDSEGNFQEYPGYGAEWRDNEPFDAAMQVIDYERGRSAVRVILKDKMTGNKYPMFISDFVGLVATNVIANGSVSGQWIGTKKGQNYGIKQVAA